jgi:hypothetical protein
MIKLEHSCLIRLFRIHCSCYVTFDQKKKKRKEEIKLEINFKQVKRKHIHNKTKQKREENKLI